MYRIGFACMYRHPERSLSLKALEQVERAFNTRTTTLRWLGSVERAAAEAKLLDVVTHNLDTQLRFVEHVADLPDNLRMLRLSSDLLPFYSHAEFAYFYRSQELQALLADRFGRLGELARRRDVRLSLHPGQFCVLGSDRPEVVENSLKEFEYHADMIRLMGYGQKFQDFKCNVHIAGRLGVPGIRAIWPRLSTEARNCITFENDEKTYGVDDCLQLADLAPVVLDIHHCWIHEEAYIDPWEPRVARIIDSWRGVRPAMHYSQPPEALMEMGVSPSERIDITFLLQQISKRVLYAHSDMMWNDWCNRYACQFLDRFDIMFEAKHKNVTVRDFYDRYLGGDGSLPPADHGILS